MSDDTPPFEVAIDPDTAAALAQLSESTETSPEALIQQAISAALDDPAAFAAFISDHPS